MRQIIVKDNLVFLDENTSFTVDCSALLEDNVVFIGESDEGLWAETEPFTGPITDYDFTEAVRIFAEAVVLQNQPPPEPTIEDLAEGKRREIDMARDMTLFQGVPHTMPDGTEEVVQIRPQDEPNLLALAIEARDLRAEGVTEPVLTIRVESNINYSLTPQQMIDLTDATKDYKKVTFAKSWILKDAVDVALNNGDREAIKAIEWGGGGDVVEQAPW